MRINLKTLTHQMNSLDFIRHHPTVMAQSIINKDLQALYDLLVIVKTDLEMAGESIVELDKNRTDAIKERDES